MIYTLFGPPGVGKTYIGQLVAGVMGMHFFDADLLIDEEIKVALRSGGYTQALRDRFIEKLVATVERLMTESEGDLVIAEAFTKEKNRFDFYRHFDGQVCYVMVRASQDLAKVRARERLGRGEHVVDEAVFEFIWDEFEAPSVRHQILTNEGLSDREIIAEFGNIVQWCQKEGV